MPQRADRMVSHLMGSRGPHKPSLILLHSGPSSLMRQRPASVHGPMSPVEIRVDRPGSRSSRASRLSVRAYSPSHPEDGGDNEFPDIDAEDPQRRSGAPSPKISVVEGEDGKVELVVDSDEPVLFSLLEETDIEGVRHLSDKRYTTRYIWAAVILVFALLAAYQIATQIRMYITTPISTNIEADYPSQVPFPVVAICNNNQYRLTYLTGARLHNRRRRIGMSNSAEENLNASSVFDRALDTAKDMDAKSFLRNAGHWKRKMILGCYWPNGTRCSHRDFKEVWTLTGLCWAINTDPMDPAYVYGAGPRHGLRLLLNIERYERIESCTPRFRTTSLPGLKILLYNQTDVALSSQEGVNVPPGYTMDIPYRMQHRQKFAGGNCEQESEEQKDISISVFDDPRNVRTCILRRFLDHIEKSCNCSMRKAFDRTPNERFPVCNVDEYYACVAPIQRWGTEGGFSTYDCRAPCEQIDYIAWQDMNELPNNIFPKIMETDAADGDGELSSTEELDDEEDSDDDEIIEQLKQCENNQLLDDKTIEEIKRAALLAYEKQSRFQEDILLRTRKLISKVNQTANRLRELRWGWHDEDFMGVHERLFQYVPCYANMTDRHSAVFDAIRNPLSRSEEHRSQLLHRLVDAADHKRRPEEFKTLSDVKRIYGEKAEKQLESMVETETLLGYLATLYDKNNFNHHLSEKLKRMDRVLVLMEKYQNGTLQKKAWAEAMQTRNMKHFFDEDLYENWYNIIAKDLDITILKTIRFIDDLLPQLKDQTVAGNSMEIGSVILFGDAEPEHQQQYALFLDDILACTTNDLRNQTSTILEEFRKAMHNFQAAYNNLFNKELLDYLSNFAFGNKFVQENFAQVNVFLHKMNVEHWQQDSTYSIWSLFCDVGGALGLFLGASLLTIIELIYLCFQYGFCKPQNLKPENCEKKSIHSGDQTAMMMENGDANGTSELRTRNRRYHFRSNHLIRHLSDRLRKRRATKEAAALAEDAEMAKSLIKSKSTAPSYEPMSDIEEGDEENDLKMIASGTTRRQSSAGGSAASWRTPDRTVRETRPGAESRTSGSYSSINIPMDDLTPPPAYSGPSTSLTPSAYPPPTTAPTERSTPPTANPTFAPLPPRPADEPLKPKRPQSMNLEANALNPPPLPPRPDSSSDLSFRSAVDDNPEKGVPVKDDDKPTATEPLAAVEAKPKPVENAASKPPLGQTSQEPKSKTPSPPQPPRQPTERRRSSAEPPPSDPEQMSINSSEPSSSSNEGYSTEPAIPRLILGRPPAPSPAEAMNVAEALRQSPQQQHRSTSNDEDKPNDAEKQTTV